MQIDGHAYDEREGTLEALAIVGLEIGSRSCQCEPSS